MNTLTEYARERPDRVRLWFERNGMRGGPFLAVEDPASLLVLPRSAPGAGRRIAVEPRDGQVTLKTGVIEDAALRHNLRTATFCGTPEYLDLWLDDGGDVVVRWRLDEARIVEVADRTRRARDDVAYASIRFTGRLTGLTLGREGDRR